MGRIVNCYEQQTIKKNFSYIGKHNIEYNSHNGTVLMSRICRRYWKKKQKSQDHIISIKKTHTQQGKKEKQFSHSCVLNIIQYLL